MIMINGNRLMLTDCDECFKQVPVVRYNDEFLCRDCLKKKLKEELPAVVKSANDCTCEVCNRTLKDATIYSTDFNDFFIDNHLRESCLDEYLEDVYTKARYEQTMYGFHVRDNEVDDAIRWLLDKTDEDAEYKDQKMLHKIIRMLHMYAMDFGK